MRRPSLLLLLLLSVTACAWLLLCGGQASSPSSTLPVTDVPAHSDRSEPTLRAGAVSPDSTSSSPRSERSDPQANKPSGFGSVQVRVLAPDGTAITERVRGYAFWRPADDETTPWSREGVPLNLACPIGESGELVFARVPVGRAIKIRVLGDRYYMGTKIGSGPTLPGEHLNWTVALGAIKSTLIVRLVDETGERMPWRSVRVQLTERGAQPKKTRWGNGNADGSAIFRYTPHFVQALNGPLDLWLEYREGEATYAAHRELPDPEGEREIDVGTVQFTAHLVPRVIASGRVLLDGGRPAHRASVHAGLRTSEGLWQPLHRSAVTTDREGRFVIQSTTDVTDEFTVYVSKRGWIGSSITARAGAEDLVFALIRGGKMRGNYIVPRGIPWDRLSISAVPTGERGSGGPNQAGGHFEYPALRPGMYDVVVRVKGTDWEFLRIEGIEVKAGKWTDDDRLRGISIEGLVCATTYRLLDAEGKALDARGVTARDDRRRGRQFRVKNGEAVVVTPTYVSEVTLRSGNAHARVAPDGGTHDVRLLPISRAEK